ncbi:ATP-binding cassette domain-containing protein [Azohydromonas aeria]|uniref:ATP-binding cassette domain-containing protein n=1 Tax=Azohydromonas aeria TaxID=2590212 RepID=UPI0012F75534|nr:ATP-binding cassette domain-containing protein [Azohydromonas aeria]
MNHPVLAVIGQLARLRGVELGPDWAQAASAATGEDAARADARSLDAVCAQLDWPAPRPLGAAPAAHHFPLPVHDAVRGWAVAEEIAGDGAGQRLRVRRPDGTAETWALDGAATAPTFFLLRLPAQPGQGTGSQALQVFVRALLARRSMLFEGVLATALLSCIGLAVSLYSMQVYDRVIPHASYSTLWVLTAGVALALLLEFALKVARAHTLDREAAEIDAEVSEHFFARAQGVRLDARPATVGTLASQLRGIDQVRNVLSSASLYFLADMPFALLLLAVVAAIGGVVAVVPLVALPLALATGAVFARAIHARTLQNQAGANQKNGLLVESIDAAETIKAVGGQWHLLRRWNALVERVTLSDHDVKRLSALAQASSGLIQQLAYVALIALGSYEVAQGRMTMGALIACSMISGRITGPVAQLPALIVQWSYARAALKGLDQILALPSDDDLAGEKLRPQQLQGDYALDGVKFGYPGTRDGLDVPQLSISPGERVGIIGPVGSGKSTLVKLLAGLYAPAQGSVRLSGMDLGQIGREVVRGAVAYLPQEYRLVAGTLRENLLLGCADPGDDALMAAAAATGLQRLIAAHPKGLALPIGEGGRGLSGGQRQLVGLTRLLLARPRVWLLDEATASLDPESEQRVLQLVGRALTPESTLVMVTHRPQLLGLVQRVIVMTGGKVLMDGPRDAVLARLAEHARATAPAAAAAAAAAKAVAPAAAAVTAAPAATVRAAQEAASA